MNATEEEQDLGILTNTRLRTARSCQFEHHVRYDLGYKPVEEAEVLRFGTLIHRGLEAWWLASKDGRPTEEWLDAAIAATQEEADPYDTARAQVLLTGYHLRWKNEPLDVIAVEAYFKAELLNPETGKASRTWSLAGKIDVIVRDQRTKLVHLVEHKTSSEDISPGSDYWKRLRMDSQISVYFRGGTALGFEIAGCVYDVLGKPGIRPFKATPEESRKYTAKGHLYANQHAEDETPEAFRERLATVVAEDPAKYFQRGDVVRLETELAGAMLDVWQLGKQIRESKLAGRFPRNPDACVRYGRTCPYFAVCTGEASLDDHTKFTRSEDVNPELTGHAQ